MLIDLYGSERGLEVWGIGVQIYDQKAYQVHSIFWIHRSRTAFEDLRNWNIVWNNIGPNWLGGTDGRDFAGESSHRKRTQNFRRWNNYLYPAWTTQRDPTQAKKQQQIWQRLRIEAVPHIEIRKCYKASWRAGWERFEGHHRIFDEWLWHNR